MRGLGRVRRMSVGSLGGLAIVALAAGIIVIYQKDHISAWLRSGDITEVEFARDYRLEPDRSAVKISGVDVGVVTGVEEESNGRVKVSLKIDNQSKATLGQAPSAAIRPTTLLGGKYYVDLVPGGAVGVFGDDKIPVERTSIPVELDRVLGAFPKQQREGLQTTVGKLNDTLKQGGREPLQRVLKHAPGVLQPAGAVLNGARGTHPGTDLTQVVSGLESTARALTHHGGQLQEIVGSLAEVSETLGDERAPVSEAVGTLPETLTTTRHGLEDLDGVLDRLTATADNARPTARKASGLLSKADPVIAEARPLARELKPLVENVRPLVEQLVPTAQQTTSTLENIRGPVLDRVNGPIMQTVLSPWRGDGPYQGGGRSGNKFYEEVGFLASNGTNMSRYRDANGGLLALHGGSGAAAPNGTHPPGLRELFERLNEPAPPPPAQSPGAPK